MNCDRILQLLNALASAFLFMDAREFDIPAAGKFLNSLDEITQEAESLGMRQVIAVSQEMGRTLEMLILDTLEDKGAGLASLGKGISRMQEIADSFKNTGGCPEEVPATTDEKADAPVAEPAAVEGEPQEAQSAGPPSAKQDEEVKIQDEALLKDFITEGLEYIDQINGGLWITGRKYCDLIVYCPWLAPVGKDLFVKRIYRDEAAIEALESDLVGFMRLVDANLATLRRPTKMTGRPKDESAPAATTPPWEPAAMPAKATTPAAVPAPTVAPGAIPAAAF